MISGNAPPIHCGIGDYTANLLAAMHKVTDRFDPVWLSRKERWFSSPMGRHRGIALRRPWHKWEAQGTTLASCYLKWKKPDLVHLQEEYFSYMEGDASLQLARKTRCPLVATLHAYHLKDDIACQTKKVLDNASRVICSDHRTANRLLDATGRKSDLVGWCSSPVIPRAFNSEQTSGPPSFATFGFVHPGKMNFHVIYDACRGLNERKSGIEWKIIGPISPKTNPQHAKLLSELRAPWLEFSGRVNDLNEKAFHERLASMTAMLLPFRNHESSNGTAPSRSSLQIAWAFGLPVIASEPTNEEPDLKDGENCLLVKEDEPDAWADAIEKLLHDQSLREALRKGSLESARLFGWDRLAEEHVKLYNQTLS